MTKKVVSLFSGIGGFDQGFINEGAEVIWANDLDKFAVQTYKANFDNEIVQANINDVDPKDIPNCDILIGGFPCQPFSISGKQFGFDDTRGTVFFTIANIIKEMDKRGHKPKCVVLENVRNLLSHDKGNTFKVIKSVLENELGYKVYYKALNSKDYGVPHNRNRVFIVCFDNHDVDFTYPDPIELNCTMQDLLESDVEEKYFLSEKSKEYIMSTGTKSWYAKPEIDLPIARCLLATMHKMHRASVDNYVTDNGRMRKLTPRECARLQGFSEDFTIPVSNTQAYKQFGNAVTVNVSQAVAHEILKVL